MSKFEKVKKALEEKTHGTTNYRTLICCMGYKGKKEYYMKNIVTQHIYWNFRFNTLNEVMFHISIIDSDN